MIKTQFIDTDFLKENSLVEFNVDDSKLNPLIFKAQDRYLGQILGSIFYEYLQTSAANNTLTIDEEYLISNYFQQLIVEWTVYISINQLSNKITNKSISNENSQYSSSADRNNRLDLKNELRDNAEYYSKRLTNYLCQHRSLFPVYDKNTERENLPKNNQSYFSGIYLPKGRGGCCK